MINIKTFQIETKLVPSPIQYDVLFPKSYDTSNEKYPLMLFLHGGGPLRHQHLKNTGSGIWEMWEQNIVPEMVVVTPLCARCFYMDYKDGSERWESFIIDELLPHLQNKLQVATTVDNTFIGGISMGGMGSLRMGLKNIDKFGAIVAFEPGIEPAFEWQEVEIEDKFYRPEWLYERIFGNPFDDMYWNKNNPAYIVRENTDKIRESGIKLYVEVGTEDTLGLYRGAEFLHRLLFDNKIRHEFRYVYGADHIGASMRERLINGFSFLSRIITPLEEPSNVLEFRDYNSQLLERALRENKK
ncbi:MAG: alpha/beta hydrolase-fold protein [Promethearchaeota archaeon]